MHMQTRDPMNNSAGDGNDTPVSGIGCRDFPITLYAVVMGLAGLTIAVEKAVLLFGLPVLGYQILLGLSSLLFVLITICYMLKLHRHPAEVLAEFDHPVKINFFSAFPISLLLLSIAFYNGYNPLLAMVLWYAALPVQVVLLLHTFSRWIRNDIDLAVLNPAWFIPIVGTIIVPVVGVDIAPLLVSVWFFAVGFFFWAALFTIKLYRLIFHKQIAHKFIPTLFILIAPPAVGMIAYFRITSTLDMFGYVLFSLALFFYILFLYMWRYFRMKQFFISWWAFTFPLDAMSIASMLLYEVTRHPFFALLSVVTIAIAALVIAYISVVTLLRLNDKTIFAD